MNLPRYKFAKETESDLLHFLKIAKQEKNRNCDLKRYEVWSRLLPPDSELIKRLEECEEAPPVIDLCSDEEIPMQPQEGNTTENATKLDTNEEFILRDIAFVIKENLDTQNNLSDIAKEHLQKCVAEDLELLFQMLEQSLTQEQIYCLGITLQTLLSNVMFTLFLRHLVFPRISKEFSDKMVDLLNQLSIKYPSILQQECLLVLQHLSQDEINIFVQHLKKMSPKFQAVIVRGLVLAIGHLDESSLMIIGTLLNNDVEYDALNKFVEMLSNVAEDHVHDKNFGKLLMTLVEALGPNLIHLDQPLKHIIAGHKSVWKAKLEKTFSTCYDDSLLFSQSFRE